MTNQNSKVYKANSIINIRKWWTIVNVNNADIFGLQEKNTNYNVQDVKDMIGKKKKMTIKELDIYCRMNNKSILLDRNKLKGIVASEEYNVFQ